jgi:heme A synthase
VQRRAQLALELLFAQGVIGYAQFFLHDNAALVELHLAGATAVFTVMVVFYLGLFQATTSSKSIDRGIDELVGSTVAVTTIAVGTRG